MTDRSIQSFTTCWKGIDLLISFERYWLGGDITSHLQITTAHPERAPLPITETGYLSHFCSAWQVDDAGGPDAFVLSWLDQASSSPKWRNEEAARRQLSLF